MTKGRPKKDKLSVRSKNVRIRLTETEYFWIKFLAEKEHTDMCSLLRNKLFEWARDNYSEEEIAYIATKVIYALKNDLKTYEEASQKIQLL